MGGCAEIELTLRMNYEDVEKHAWLGFKQSLERDLVTALCAVSGKVRVRRWAARSRTLQRTTLHYNTLQHTTMYCNTLRHTAIHCNTL